MDEALDVLRDALAVVDRPESLATPMAARGPAVVLNNIGATVASMGRPEEALEPIRRGLSIRRGLAADDGAPDELFWSSLVQHASVLTELRRLDEAREAAEECLEVGSELVRGKISRPRVEAQAQIMLAENLIDLAEGTPTAKVTGAGRSDSSTGPCATTAATSKQDLSWPRLLPGRPKAASLAGLSATSQQVASIASSRSPRQKAPGVASVPIGFAGVANSTRSGSAPSRWRARNSDDFAGTCHSPSRPAPRRPSTRCRITSSYGAGENRASASTK
nr:tetratricopeptide repeat protein [Streptomyces cavernae]